MTKRRLIVGITAPGSSVLIEGQLAYFNTLNYTTYLLAPNDKKVKDFCRKEGCIHLPVKIRREISPLIDICTLVQIVRHFVTIKAPMTMT